MQILCIGTIIAATITYQKLMDIEHDANLTSMIDNELLLKTKATAAVAIAAGVIMIPEGIGMIIVLTVLHLIQNMNVSGILDMLASTLVCVCMSIVLQWSPSIMAIIGTKCLAIIEGRPQIRGFGFVNTISMQWGPR